MAAQRKYPVELRERATRLTVEARKDSSTRAGACKRIGEQMGINTETLRSWVTQAEVDGGLRGGTSSDDAARLNELEKEVGELRRANSILRSSAAFRGGAGPPVALIVDYIDQHKDDHGAPPICQALNSAEAPIARRPSTPHAPVCHRPG